MIGCTPNLLDIPVAYNRTEQGTSEAALFIAAKLKEFSEHYSEPRRQILEPEIMALLSSTSTDKESVAVTLDTAQQALTFAMLLPKSLPIPGVAADPDGEVCV